MTLDQLQSEHPTKTRRRKVKARQEEITFRNEPFKLTGEKLTQWVNEIRREIQAEEQETLF